MRFGTSWDSQQISVEKERKRDYDTEAQQLKKRIDDFKNFESTIKKLLYEYLSWLDRQEGRHLLVHMIGAFSLEIPVLEGEYESILAEMEKEK